MMNDNNSAPHKDHNELAKSVLARIKSEHIEPTPRWQFLFHESIIWGLWFLSILLGAVAVSVMIFVFLFAGYTFYEATHDTAFEFMVEVLPVVWGLVFIGMLALAYFNMRHTRTGYRYPLWQLVISSLVLSLFGGVLLHSAGLGYFIDTQLSKSMPMLRTFNRIETQMWQAPDKGRLVGTFAVTEGREEAEAHFIAVDGTEWLVDISELMDKDLEWLESGEQVRVLGLVATDTDAYFYGCAVVPWMLGKPKPLTELRAERDIFIERMEHHAERLRAKGEEQLETLGLLPEEDRERAVVPPAEAMHCPRMPLIKRLMPGPEPGQA